MLNNEYLLSKNFLKSVECELGPIKTANQQIPGVYYILADQEAYAVADMSPIFPKVKLYGQQIQEFLLFSMENDTSGWRIVDYEMCKYMIQHHIDPPPENLLHDLALYAAEYHPEYFGWRLANAKKCLPSAIRSGNRSCQIWRGRLER